jgi:hypothetical protein
MFLIAMESGSPDHGINKFGVLWEATLYFQDGTILLCPPEKLNILSSHGGGIEMQKS